MSVRRSFSGSKINRMARDDAFNRAVNKITKQQGLPLERLCQFCHKDGCDGDCAEYYDSLVEQDEEYNADEKE